MKREVQRGAKLLSRGFPGWARSVKLRTLDMHDCKQCVLGQLFGGYDIGRSVLRAHMDASPHRRDVTAQGIECGFGFDIAGREYARLTDLWKDEIRARR